MDNDKKIKAIKKIIFFMNLSRILNLLCLILFLCCFPLFIWIGYMFVFKLMLTSIIVYLISLFLNKSLAAVKKQLETGINN